MSPCHRPGSSRDPYSSCVAEPVEQDELEIPGCKTPRLFEHAVVDGDGSDARMHERTHEREDRPQRNVDANRVRHAKRESDLPISAVVSGGERNTCR